MEIHSCLFQLDEAHQHTAMLHGIPPDHQRTPFCHLLSDMSHDLFQQPPVAQGQENQKTKLSRKWLRNEENMARARRQVELIHEMNGEEEN